MVLDHSAPRDATDGDQGVGAHKDGGFLRDDGGEQVRAWEGHKRPLSGCLVLRNAEEGPIAYEWQLQALLPNNQFGTPASEFVLGKERHDSRGNLFAALFRRLDGVDKVGVLAADNAKVDQRNAAHGGCSCADLPKGFPFLRENFGFLFLIQVDDLDPYGCRPCKRLQ